MILSGATGETLRKAAMPDEAETYLSPLWVEQDPRRQLHRLWQWWRDPVGQPLEGDPWRAYGQRI